MRWFRCPSPKSRIMMDAKRDIGDAGLWQIACLVEEAIQQDIWELDVETITGWVKVKRDRAERILPYAQKIFHECSKMFGKSQKISGKSKDSDHQNPHGSTRDQEKKREEKNNTSPNGEAQSASHPIWGDGLQMLMDQGEKESSARAFLGRALRDYGEGALNEAISACILQPPVNAKAFLIATLQIEKRQHPSKPKGSNIPAGSIVLAHERKGGSGKIV